MIDRTNAKTVLWILGLSACLAAGCSSQENVEPPVVRIEEAPMQETGGSLQPEEPPDYAAMPAGTIVEEALSPEETEALFTVQKIAEEVSARITGVSYVENDDISLSELRYLRLLHTGFDEKTHIGELIVHVSIADTVLDIFRELYAQHYPIEKMLLVDEYGGDDNASMQDNNTSAFNYRPVEGSSHLSRHAYGLALDINPLYNPYVTYPGGQAHYSPDGSEAYADRTQDFPHKISKEGDLCWQLFHEQGFTWGGDWNSVKDYQHFQLDITQR